MRWLRSNGRRLEVREVSKVEMTLIARTGQPLPIVDEVLDDDVARERLRRLLQLGFPKAT